MVKHASLPVAAQFTLLLDYWINWYYFHKLLFCTVCMTYILLWFIHSKLCLPSTNRFVCHTISTFPLIKIGSSSFHILFPSIERGFVFQSRDCVRRKLFKLHFGWAVVWRIKTLFRFKIKAHNLLVIVQIYIPLPLIELLLAVLLQKYLFLPYHCTLSTYTALTIRYEQLMLTTNASWQFRAWKFCNNLWGKGYNKRWGHF